MTKLSGERKEYWQERYEERASIMEYDGGMTREDAEAAAKKEIQELIKQEGKKDA